MIPPPTRTRARAHAHIDTHTDTHTHHPSIGAMIVIHPSLFFLLPLFFAFIKGPWSFITL